MSLFDAKKAKNQPLRKSASVNVPTWKSAQAAGLALNEMQDSIGKIDDWTLLTYYTNGAWSMPALTEYILRQTGPADLFITTWSVSDKPLDRLKRLKKEGLIRKMVFRFDPRMNDFKKEAFAALKDLADECYQHRLHAKVVVFRNEKYHICLCGSANFTENPREEAGTILHDINTAKFHIKWITKGENIVKKLWRK